MTDTPAQFIEWDKAIPSPDAEAAARSQARWNSLAKPLGSLGALEEAVVRIAGIAGDAGYSLDKRAVAVLCADNGVADRGVSAVGAEVTAVLARNLAKGDLSVCKMARVARADVFGVDMGLRIDRPIAGLLDRCVAPGTNDIAAGPAMAPEQAVRAVRSGVELAAELAAGGYRIIATGEAGIGNTTTSSAMTAVLLGERPGAVTGAGAGLDGNGVARKIDVIEQALRVNSPDPGDALDVLAKLGGFDIAGMAGVFIGGALHRVPVLVDGFISSVAALTAARLCPASQYAMLASHVSAEPAARTLLEVLRLNPLIAAGMRLGEGTGAVAALPLLDMAYAVYTEMPTYADIDIGRYQPGA